MITIQGYPDNLQMFMGGTIPDMKRAITALLKLLASKDEQLAYEKNVPIADVPAELLCQWFDDVYHPEDKLFQSCFTPQELKALEAFNQFYDERSKLLPDNYTGIKTWLDTKTWREIMEEAGKTLQKITPNQT